MGWLSNAISNPGKALTSGVVGSALGGGVLTGALGTLAGGNNAQAQKEAQQQQDSYLNAASASNLTPAQQQQAREDDISRGQARGNEIFVNDPRMQSILKQREDMANGVNAQEYQGLRDDMIKGQQGANAGYMRQLLSAQGQGGVGGARAAAQQGELVQKFGQNRADAERKLLLDNIALKREGTDSLQDFLLKQKYGTLAQGLGEAQLGVADRTGYMQNQIGQAMANAAGQQPKQGLVSSIFGGIL